mgnify:CR=1 FL=1
MSKYDLSEKRKFINVSIIISIFVLVLLWMAFFVIFILLFSRDILLVFWNPIFNKICTNVVVDLERNSTAFYVFVGLLFSGLIFLTKVITDHINKCFMEYLDYYDYKFISDNLDIEQTTTDEKEADLKKCKKIWFLQEIYYQINRRAEKEKIISLSRINEKIDSIMDIIKNIKTGS